MVQGRPGNAGCPPSLGELTAFGPNENAAPRGMTLVELLVVLAIIMMVAAATIPRLKPEMDRARVREAARSIQLYLSSTRNQAMATGRSVGVQIERLPAENGCSMSLTQLETPPLYAGDFTNSVAQAAPYAINPTPPGNLATGLIQIESWNSSSLYAVVKITFAYWPSVPIFPYDRIQFNHQGPWYTVASTSLVTYTTSNGYPPTPSTPASPLTLYSMNNVTQQVVPLLNGSNQQVALPTAYSSLLAYVDLSLGQQCACLASSYPVVGSYSIMRYPTKSVAAGLQLPAPACIDLMWSGIDPVAPADTPTWLPPHRPRAPCRR